MGGPRSPWFPVSYVGYQTEPRSNVTKGTRTMKDKQNIKKKLKKHVHVHTCKAKGDVFDWMNPQKHSNLLILNDSQYRDKMQPFL